MTYYQVAGGVFVAWGTGLPRIGHADLPLDLYEVSSDVVSLLTSFTEPADVDAVLSRLALDDSTCALMRHALEDLHKAGILMNVGAGSAGTGVPSSIARERLREPGQEVARAVELYPDITALHPGFAETYQRFLNKTLTSLPMAYAFSQALRYVMRVGLPGAVVECGVWRGGSMALAASVLMEAGVADRELWLYDTFEWSWEQAGEFDRISLAPGLDIGADDLAPGPPDHFVEETSLRDVIALLDSTGYPPQLIRAVPGLVQDTLPGSAPDRIAVLRLDTDLYESTRHELVELYPRLLPGGVLIVDDYGKFDGATAAVDDYLRGVGDEPLLHRVDTQGRVAVKPGRLDGPGA
jgi:O-methyltransferase